MIPMRNKFTAAIFCFKLLYALSWAKQLGKETIVFPELVQSREQNGLKLLKINQDLTLSLEKSSVVGEEFLLRTYQGPVMEHRYLDGNALEEDLYHDAGSLASVMVSEENGLVVEGIIGPTLRIKPLKEHERTQDGRVPHRVYEYHDDTAQGWGKGIAVARKTDNLSERQYVLEHSFRIPEKIFPEFIIMADSLFRQQFRSENELLRYVLITVNSANLRYLSVSEPAVQLKICALEVLNTTQEAFIERHPGKLVEGYATLMGLQKHVTWKNYELYKEYDGVYLFTGGDMVDYGGRDKWYHGLQGIAYVAGVCGTFKVALGEDAAGTYKGVRVLSHEVGHLLGCPHDGDGLGLQSSKDCSFNDGYIMSYKQYDRRSMQFSHCCNREMTKLVRFYSKICLLVANVEIKIPKNKFTSKLPGDVIKSRNEQCQLAFPNVTDTYYVQDEDCEENCQVRCSMPDPSGCEEASLQTFLMDNSECNNSSKHVCINGECRPKKKEYPVEPVKEVKQ